MRVRCLKCNYLFDTTYARTFACSTCSLAVLGNCEYIKCPRCGHEFELDIRPKTPKFRYY